MILGTSSTKPAHELMKAYVIRKILHMLVTLQLPYIPQRCTCLRPLCSITRQTSTVTTFMSCVCTKFAPYVPSFESLNQLVVRTFVCMCSSCVNIFLHTRTLFSRLHQLAQEEVLSSLKIFLHGLFFSERNSVTARHSEQSHEWLTTLLINMGEKKGYRGKNCHIVTQIDVLMRCLKRFC